MERKEQRILRRSVGHIRAVERQCRGVPRLIGLSCVYEQNFSICGLDLLEWVRHGDRSNRNSNPTCGRDYSPEFQANDRRWQSGQSERLPGQMGRALFLSKGFYERLHDGGEKLS